MKKLMFLCFLVLISCNKEDKKEVKGPVKNGEELEAAEVLSKDDLESLDKICEALVLQRERLESGKDMGRRLLLNYEERDCSSKVKKEETTVEMVVPFDSEKASLKSLNGVEIITTLVTDTYYMVNLYCELGETSNQWQNGTTKYRMRVVNKDQVEVAQYKEDDDKKWRAKRVESFKTLLNGRDSDKGLTLLHEQGLFCSNNVLSYKRQYIK